MKKGGGVLCATAGVKDAWIHQQHTAFRVSRMCRLLAVSRSGYYEWLSRPPRPPTDTGQEVHDTIQPYVAHGRGLDGTRRIKHL